MNIINFLNHCSVKVLTAFVIFASCSCSYIQDYYGETCNSHAYLQRVLADHISSRFYKNAPVRMAVIPYSVPANFSAASNEQPGLGNLLAWELQSLLLESGQVPIVEVFNRQDWPMKKEEFFTGNFGALSMAHQAGYDMLLVGYVEPQKSTDTISAYTKVMDVDSGVTVYYGKSTAHTSRPYMNRLESHFWVSDQRPANLYFENLIDTLSNCISKDVLSDGLEEE